MSGPRNIIAIGDNLDLTNFSDGLTTGGLTQSSMSGIQLGQESSLIINSLSCTFRIQYVGITYSFWSVIIAGTGADVNASGYVIDSIASGSTAGITLGFELTESDWNYTNIVCHANVVNCSFMDPSLCYTFAVGPSGWPDVGSVFFAVMLESIWLPNSLAPPIPVTWPAGGTMDVNFTVLQVA